MSAYCSLVIYGFFEPQVKCEKRLLRDQILIELNVTVGHVKRLLLNYNVIIYFPNTRVGITSLENSTFSFSKKSSYLNFPAKNIFKAIF